MYVCVFRHDFCHILLKINPIMGKTTLMKKNQRKTILLKSIISMQILLIVLVLMGCNGCLTKKIVTIDDAKTKPLTKTEISAQKSDTILSSQGVIDPNWKPDPQIPITRSFMGRNVTFNLNPNQPGGEDIKVVYEDTIHGISTHNRWVSNQITQLSTTVLLYSQFPREVGKDFYYDRQPMKLEFMDSIFRTIKTVDIWKDRPYQEVGDKKLTYYHFDAEGMEVVPYKNQKTLETPNEMTLFTSVRSEGMHVIVNYELRSLKTVQNGEHTYSKMTGVKHTLHIYDLSGNLIYTLRDMPSVDGAVVSNNGKYMMYTFGGIGLATANNPFGTIEREGWALMRLSDQKIVYKEYTDNGILAFNRLWKDTESNLLMLGYSTPSNEIDYDYYIIFDENDNNIYTRKMPFSESKEISNYWKINKKLNYRYHIKKFNFQLISIPNN